MASFPESEELHTASHISTGIFKKGKLAQSIQVPQTFTSKYIDDFGSTTVAQNTRGVFFLNDAELAANAQV